MSGSDVGSNMSAQAQLRQGDFSSNPGTSSLDEVVARDDLVVEQEVHFENVGLDDRTLEVDNHGYTGDESKAVAGNDSEAVSQAGSDTSGYTTEAPHFYLDMTRGNYCMVLMSRTEKGI